MNQEIKKVKQMVADGYVSQDVVEMYFPELKKEQEDKCFEIDLTKDYRHTLTMWRVDDDGDLVWVKDKNGKDKSYFIIEKSRLTEDDWLTHMHGKMEVDEFGEFACAYFKACEMAGITNLKVTLRGEFNQSFKYSDEE